MTKNDQKDLKWAMKSALALNKQVRENVELLEFAKKEITYEQLLNLCFNPEHKEVYLESEILEEFARDIILELASSPSSLDKFSFVSEMILQEDEAAREFAKTQPQAPSIPPEEMTRIKAETQGGRGTGASDYAKYLAKKSGKYAMGHKLAVGAGLAAAAGGLYIYKKMKNAGQSEKDASLAAAQASRNSGDMKAAQRWEDRAETL